LYYCPEEDNYFIFQNEMDGFCPISIFPKDKGYEYSYMIDRDVTDFQFKEEQKSPEACQADIISRLQSLTIYRAGIGGEPGGSWVEHEVDKYGDWIKVEDIEALIKELQSNVR